MMMMIIMMMIPIDATLVRIVTDVSPVHPANTPQPKIMFVMITTV